MWNVWNVTCNHKANHYPFETEAEAEAWAKKNTTPENKHIAYIISCGLKPDKYEVRTA